MAELRVIERGPKQGVVGILRDLLADAEAGKIVEVVVTSTYTGGHIAHDWSGCEDLYRLLSALHRQAYLTQQRMDG